jgi:hypothetical protein
LKTKGNFRILLFEKYEKSFSVLSHFHVFLVAFVCSWTRGKYVVINWKPFNTLSALNYFDLCLFFIKFLRWDARVKGDKWKKLHETFFLSKERNKKAFSSSLSLALKHISSIIIKLYFPAIIAIHFSCLQLFLLVFLSQFFLPFCFCFYDNFWQFMLYDKDKGKRYEKK